MEEIQKMNKALIPCCIAQLRMLPWWRGIAKQERQMNGNRLKYRLVWVQSRGKDEIEADIVRTISINKDMDLKERSF